MGPFKHEVDDGLDLRKAAFECMYTLLDTCVDRIDIFEFLSHVQDGLKDHYDIKVQYDHLSFKIKKSWFKRRIKLRFLKCFLTLSIHAYV